MTKKEFIKMFDDCIKDEMVTEIIVHVSMPDLKRDELITNPRENFETKKAYYDKAYNDKMELESFPKIKIVGVQSNKTTIANQEKDLEISEVKEAKKNISDLKIYGDGDTFSLLCKASSQAQGWMKSTKVCNVRGGCLVQVTTQQRNPDGTYAVAEALTYAPHANILKTSNPRRLVYVKDGEILR